MPGLRIEFEPVSRSGRASGEADGLGAMLADALTEGAGSLAPGPAAQAVSATATSNDDASWDRLMVNMIDDLPQLWNWIESRIACCSARSAGEVPS